MLSEGISVLVNMLKGYGAATWLTSCETSDVILYVLSFKSNVDCYDLDANIWTLLSRKA